MSQSFHISSSDNLDYKKYLSPGGTTISYIASILLFFLPNEFKYTYYWIDENKRKYESNLKDYLDYFSDGGELMGLNSLSKTQFNQIYKALKDGYEFLKSLSPEDRSEWIEENTIYGHVKNLWDHDIWGTYENYKGEERNNNMKNILEDVLEMMELDERFDKSILEKSGKEKNSG